MNYQFSLASALASLTTLPLLAADLMVASPDGRLVVTLSDAHHQAQYSVTYDGIQVLQPSALGLITNEQDLARSLSIVDSETSQIDDHYILSRAKVSQVHYVANRLVCTFQNEAQQHLQAEFRISNNDVALRYLLPKDGETGSIRVLSEATSFSFPEGTTTFLSSQSEAMVGWKRTKPSYEEFYTWDAPMALRSASGHGYTFPCLFHEYGRGHADEMWVMVSETGVDSHYCASHLSDAHVNPVGPQSLPTTDQLRTYSIAFPMPEENNGIGGTDAAFQLPGATPWRTLTIGRTLKPIAETTVPWDNVRPLYESTFQNRYGRGTWSWILWQDESINYRDLCQYVDLAKAMGYEYVLVDNWWDTNLGKRSTVNGQQSTDKKTIEDVIDYAHQQGIDVFLWYSSSGYWNDIVQGPTSRMDNSIIRKREMRWMKLLGVKGIKVDFFGGDKQETIRLYEEILSDADDAGLMVIFHGCTIPRGWERMYPNYVGSEAVLASENLIFGQEHCDLEARHAALHPVLRNTIGCMEFGGSFQNKYMTRDNQPRPKGHTNTRLTTSCFSLATAVLYQNPIQNFALAPNNLQDAPAVAMDFMRQVPTTWDEIRYIDGYPGEYQVIARRSGDVWYLAAINATPQPLKLTLDLAWLSASTLRLYSGGDHPVVTTPKLKKQKLDLTLPTNDGVVLIAE